MKMVGLVVCPILKKDDPLFQQEKSLLIQSAKLFDIELIFCSLLDCEEILCSSKGGLGFVYFYEEDLGFEDLAYRLGIFSYSNPKNYVSGHDLGTFYRLLKLRDIPTPIAYACPKLSGVNLADCFELLSLRMKEAGVDYPLNLRKKSQVNRYNAELCLTPMEFNAALRNYAQEPFVAEEFIDGPLLLALVIGKQCVGVIENKDGEYVKSSLDNRFVRHEAELCAKSLDRESALVIFKRHGKTPLCVGTSSDLHLALFECIYRSGIGEKFFAALLKTRRKKKHFAYVSDEEVRAQRKAFDN